jgi:hypothetical protein
MIQWMRLASSMMLLGFEAQRVMLLRAIRIATGGAHAQAEINRMVSEKVFATVRAMGMMTLGRSPASVIRHYRSQVRANERRLTRRKR